MIGFRGLRGYYDRNISLRCKELANLKGRKRLHMDRRLHIRNGRIAKSIAFSFQQVQSRTHRSRLLEQHVFKPQFSKLLSQLFTKTRKTFT